MKFMLAAHGRHFVTATVIVTLNSYNTLCHLQITVIALSKHHNIVFCWLLWSTWYHLYGVISWLIVSYRRVIHFLYLFYCRKRKHSGNRSTRG